ncbi:MAG: hypothetical protein ACE5FA_10665 [Dehalococcoidia bacterium]
MVTAHMSATRVDQANDGGNAAQRGCIRLDIVVTPANGDQIRDVHLLVGETLDSGPDRRTTAGDPRGGNYANVASLPDGWSYQGIVGRAPAPVTNKRRWYLTWTGASALTAETTLSVVYSGGREVTEQDGRVFITSDGSDNPRSKPIGRPRRGWAPD